MLDLTALSIRKYELKFLGDDGVVYNLNLSELPLDKLKKIQNIKGEKIENISQIATEIINCNTDGKEFSVEFIEKSLRASALTVFFTDYLKWINEVKNNPNS